MFFHIFCRLHYLLDKKQDLVFDTFPLLKEYKQICEKQEIYNSKKASAIYRSFYVNTMIYHLFQNYPYNFLEFIKANNLTYREFTHGLKYIPYWYEKMLSFLVPKQNKIGREISESEVIGVIKYLKNQGKVINQLNVAEIVGCHSTIHGQFKQIYKRIFKLIK